MSSVAVREQPRTLFTGYAIELRERPGDHDLLSARPHGQRVHRAIEPGPEVVAEGAVGVPLLFSRAMMSADGPVDVGDDLPRTTLPSACAPSAKTMPFGPSPVLVEKEPSGVPSELSRATYLLVTLLTFSKYPPMTILPSVCTAMAWTSSSLGPLPRSLVLNPASTVPSSSAGRCAC